LKNLPGSLFQLLKGNPTDIQSYRINMLLKEIENIENSINSLQTAPSEDAAISFACDYKDSGNGVKSFANYLMACSNEFQKSHNLFMSPYVAIVQSSMYGKTRLLREIARSYYRVVYVCLREEWSTGYPPRTLEGTFLRKRH